MGCDRHEAVGFVGGIILRDVIAETEVVCILDAACKRPEAMSPQAGHGKQLRSRGKPVQPNVPRAFHSRGAGSGPRGRRRSSYNPPTVIPATVALALIPN